MCICYWSYAWLIPKSRRVRRWIGTAQLSVLWTEPWCSLDCWYIFLPFCWVAAVGFGSFFYFGGNSMDWPLFDAETGGIYCCVNIVSFYQLYHIHINLLWPPRKILLASLSISFTDYCLPDQTDLLNSTGETRIRPSDEFRIGNRKEKEDGISPLPLPLCRVLLNMDKGSAVFCIGRWVEWNALCTNGRLSSLHRYQHQSI